MLSFSDSQSFSVSGMSGYSNFSAYESSVSLAGGTFKVRWHMTVTLQYSCIHTAWSQPSIHHHVQVYEDSSCVDQPSSARPPGKQSMRTSRVTNLSSVLESTNQGSFQAYEDSLQSIHGSRRMGDSAASWPFADALHRTAVAAQCAPGEYCMATDTKARLLEST